MEFLKSKQAKRAYWTMLNVVMGFIVAWLTHLAGADVAWAGVVVVPATALSQMLTKHLNSQWEKLL